MSDSGREWPSERSIEDRVEVERMGASEHVFVLLDGEVVYEFDGEQDAEDHAEIYRLGLIVKMKRK